VASEEPAPHPPPTRRATFPDYSVLYRILEAAASDTQRTKTDLKTASGLSTEGFERYFAWLLKHGYLTHQDRQSPRITRLGLDTYHALEGVVERIRAQVARDKGDEPNEAA